MVNLERYILLIEINSQMACWYTHPIIRERMGSIPNLTTVASRFDGRVKVPLLEKSNDSWKDSNSQVTAVLSIWVRIPLEMVIERMTGSNPVLTTYRLVAPIRRNSQ